MSDTKRKFETIYRETQKFRQWWLWMIVLVGPVFTLGVLARHIFGYGAIDDGLNDITITLIVVFIIGLIFPVFLLVMRLESQVTGQGLCIRFRPFHWKWIIIPFEKIKLAEPLMYRPLRDYGGWGIRYGKMGKAYNVSGNRGVLLTFDTGTPILIGSQNHELLAATINSKLKYL
ncbi:hypothetical protein FIM02_00465 [SAR202 cluster bacterium AD-802-E10_MRT_200m]|nr:hypothetical protein [SAR202 cluster bacterium AD-802-E10_MRT_200m]